MNFQSGVPTYSREFIFVRLLGGADQKAVAVKLENSPFFFQKDPTQRIVIAYKISRLRFAGKASSDFHVKNRALIVSDFYAQSQKNEFIFFKDH